jgi:hypothetical protein
VAVVVAAARQRSWRQCDGGNGNAVMVRGKIEKSSSDGKKYVFTPPFEPAKM